MGTYDLTTAALVKAYEGITISTDDTLIGTLIERVTASFEGYCQRQFKSRAYSYTADLPNARLNGNDSFNGQKSIILPQFPIVTITTVRINEQAIDESTGISVSGWFIADQDAGIIGLRGYLWLYGEQNIELTYTAGYATIPDDLAQAAIEQVLMEFKRGKKEHLLGISSIGHADGSVTRLSGELLPSVKRVLNRYKRLM